MPTPIDSSLRTGWVAVATEGESIDGRIITATWITEMAETYDPEFYCAQLWPEHEHRFENMGHVEALKTDTVDGKLTLFAVLSPTTDLIYQNRRGQLKFCSIEPWENFAGTGKTYLFGIGVTNRPASTGTTMLKFSAKHAQRLVGKSMPLDLSGFSCPSDMDDATERVSLLHKVFNFLGGHGAPTAAIPTESPTRPQPEDSTDMNEEQMNKLAGMFTALGTQIETFGAKVDALTADKQPAVTEPATVVDPAPVAVTSEQFSAFEQTLKGLGEQLTGLNAKIEKFSVEAPDQRPDALGGSDTHPTVC
ncbi:GPO family capsid scaffolding protein [Aeromonas hydrophila]|uniref:GPO family capsid scaffolding protein n=1 Tax=Aeromonas hydrophila TaxID=644 RepID=UPI000D0DDC51|nr:GPO family capsid scaffolding protein [Aeromonas hydrophila]AVP85202.1 capsid protein [Aeromonas hydrophila]EIS3738069.1 GPO family capsid scaffolding protein [Aeromonas hydrophila]